MYTSDGFLVQVNNVNVTKFNSNKVDFFTSIDAKQNYIYNVPQPIHPYDVCAKGYADGLAKKCHVGLIPSLSRNTDKSGYVVTASSERSSTCAAFKAFRTGNTEWTTNGVTSNFWIKIKCLQAVRVWKYVLTGRRNDSSELIHNCRLEGSNDDSEWTLIRSGNPFTIDSASHQFIVENNTISYEDICCRGSRNQSWTLTSTAVCLFRLICLYK